MRTLPPLLYGADHAYGIPFTGSGSEAGIKTLIAADLRTFQQDWLRPDNVKILVAGDTTLDRIIPALDAAFGDWKAPATTVPHKNIATVEAITPAEAEAAIRQIVAPEAMTWAIVGDLKQIDAPVRALNLGEVQVIDADGRPVAE